MSKNSKSKEKDHSKIKWFIQVFIITFILSIFFSYISTYGVSNMNHKRKQEYVENIRIEEYNEICSEKFRMTINLWRIREFPFRKKWTFFHE